MSVKRKYNKANIHINGKFVPSNKGKFIVDAEYVRDDRTDESLLNSLEQLNESVEESSQEINERIDNMFNGDKIKSDLLPSYIDDILEFEEFSDFPDTGETGIIYLDLETGYTYRWSGSEYVVHQAQADWNQSDATAPDYIKNKPQISSSDIFMVTVDTITNKIDCEYQDLIDAINSRKIINVLINNVFYIVTISDIDSWGTLSFHAITSSGSSVPYKQLSYVTINIHNDGAVDKFSGKITGFDSAASSSFKPTATNIKQSSDLDDLISASKLKLGYLYYTTDTDKLYLATSINTLVEITTTPYTPSV